MSDDSNVPAREHLSGGMGFGMVQADIFRDRSLPANVKLVYVALATYADDRRTAFPSQQRIADDTGLSLRSVKRAVKAGEEAGLFEVIHTQASNRYRLRDLKVGGYVLGSGPECHSDTSEVQDSHSGSAPVAHEQDQRSRPASQTISTSSVAASGAPLASSRGDDEPAIRIFLPRDFKRWDDGRAFQYLVKAAIATMREVGKEPAPDAADRIGHALKVSAQDHDVDRERLVAMLEGTIRLAGTDNANWGSLATIDPWAS